MFYKLQLFTIFLPQINDWFDCFNVRVPQQDTRNRTKAYGLALEEQSNILESMTNTIRNLRVKDKSSLLPFQSGNFNCLWSKRK
jgi:hypothetical protein